MDVPSTELEQLFDRAGWVRALARRLADDTDAADDLAQNAWIVAARRPAPDGVPIRSWLGGIVRRLARGERREHARRLRHERAAGARDDARTHEQWADTLDTYRNLIEAVRSLDEPYRETVLLRFFEDLPVRDVAARLGVPPATVHTRLQRAFAALRRKLDRDCGSRGAWAGAFVPAAGSGRLWNSGPTVMIAMKSKILIAVAACCAAALSLWLLQGGKENMQSGALRGARSAETAAEGAIERPADAAGGGGAARAATGSAAQSAVPSRPESTPAVAAAPTAVVRGRVLDVSARPVPSVRVVAGQSANNARAAGAAAAAGEAAAAVTDADGRFEFAGLADEPVLAVDDARWITVLGALGRRGSRDVVIIAAEKISIGGRVVDESGAGVAGARIDWKPPAAFRASFAEVLDLSQDVECSTRSDAEGRFEWPAAPRVADATLAVAKIGFLGAAVPAPADSTPSMMIILKRAAAAAGSWSGVVVDAHGEPVSGAAVSSGGRMTRSDERGRFALAAEGAKHAVLTAVKAHYLPASADAAIGDDGTAAQVTLRLVGEERSIRGRVLNTDGAPARNALVWADNPTWFGTGDGRGALAVEMMLSPDSEPPIVQTDPEGRFELKHLAAKDYAVAAADLDSMSIARKEGITAGARDVELRVQGANVAKLVAGVVVDRRGDPVEGVLVRPWRRAFRLPMPGGGHFVRNASGARVVTDAQGRFEFHHLSTDDVSLVYDSDRICGDLASLAGRADLEALRIEVALRCHVKIELRDAGDDVDHYQFLDAAGRTVPFEVWKGEMVYGDVKGEFAHGRTEMLSVSEEVRTLVLLKGAAEKRRVAVELNPKEPTILRP